MFILVIVYDSGSLIYLWLFEVVDQDLNFILMETTLRRTSSCRFLFDLADAYDDYYCDNDDANTTC